jgi:diguanylate cyclase (GGDEF)-like protein
VAAALMLHSHGAQQALILADSVTMIATNTVFTLILSYTLEHAGRKAWLLSRIEELQGQALEAATRKLHELSVLDPLTGIPNRRLFEEDMSRVWHESMKARRSVAMLIIDVDFFKRYNDGYGHPQGDRCLKQVATAISETTKAAQGLVARLGGEEFGVLLPGADTLQAVQLGERICQAVRQLALEHLYSQVPGQAIVTVSVGASAMRAQREQAPNTLFESSDDALYRAKHDGRDRVAVPVELPQEAELAIAAA